MQVTCAIIIQNKSVLLAQRASGHDRAGQWEFPGGKIHPGESAEACIHREIMEELGVAIFVLLQGPDVQHSYPDKSISLIPFICNLKSGTPQALVHEALCWKRYDCLSREEMCAADRRILDWFLTVVPQFLP